MGVMWALMVGLCLLAVLFVVWPLWRRRSLVDADRAAAEQRTLELDRRLQANVELFREHLEELTKALAEGRIDQEQFEQLKLEQERGLLEDERTLAQARRQSSVNSRSAIWLLLTTVLLVPLGAFWLYSVLGSAADVHLVQLQEQKSRLDYQDMLANRSPDPERTRTLVAFLERRAAAEPDNMQYWFMLARNRMELGEYAEAVSAYWAILELDDNSSLVRAELAQAMYFAEGYRMTEEIGRLVYSALEMDPANSTALGLAGIHAFEQADYAGAVTYWTRASRLLHPHSSTYAALQSGIARAQRQLEASGETLPTAPVTADAGASVELEVTLGTQVEAAPDQVVFVYARAWQGAAMPLAIVRLSAADLPARVTLDDSQAMAPGATLSSADQVELVARLSLSGDPTPASGDWQGSVGPVDPREPPAELRLVIDQPINP